MIETQDRVSDRFVDRPTLPSLRPDHPITNAGESAEVLAAITGAVTLARGRIAPRDRLLAQVLIALETIAGDSAGNFAAAVLSARALYGVRAVASRSEESPVGVGPDHAGKVGGKAPRGIDPAGVVPLYDALDQARILIAASVHQLRTPPPIRVRALRALSTAHQRLVGATTGLVLEAVRPIRDRLREAQAVTGELRDAVARAERRRADLERKFATIVDPSLPWGARGATEW